MLYSLRLFLTQHTVQKLAAYFVISANNATVVVVSVFDLLGEASVDDRRTHMAPIPKRKKLHSYAEIFVCQSSCQQIYAR